MPADPMRLVDVMLGRTLECLAPLILSDNETIYLITEVANREKAMRLISVNSNETEVDMKCAWGFQNAFKITVHDLNCSNRDKRELFYDFKNLYLSLADEE